VPGSYRLEKCADSLDCLPYTRHENIWPHDRLRDACEVFEDPPLAHRIALQDIKGVNRVPVELG
jgi:hypothetical protein